MRSGGARGKLKIFEFELRCVSSRRVSLFQVKILNLSPNLQIVFLYYHMNDLRIEKLNWFENHNDEIFYGYKLQIIITIIYGY